MEHKIHKSPVVLAITVITALALSMITFTGCASNASSSANDAGMNSPSAAASSTYFSQQEVMPSPEWVTNLPVANEPDTKQFIVVAGVGETTAYVTMHQKDESGNWNQIIATPGFIGKEGLGPADSYHSYTPIGTFTIDRAFGLAEDPGCKMDYLQVDDTYYWSGDERAGMHFNELVSINDLPELDTEESEQIAEYEYAYQYVLNMGFNSECKPGGGSAFFFHSFRVNRPYTGGCVAVPEDIMKFIMCNIEGGCRITIDSLDNMGGDLDAGYEE